MVEFIYSGSVAGEHQFRAVCLEILDHYRLRREDHSPCTGVRIDRINSISVVRDGSNVYIVFEPCGFDQLKAVWSV